MVPGENMESVLGGIRSVIEPMGATAYIPDQPVLTHTGLRLDGPSYYPGWLLDEEHPLIQAGISTGAALWNKTLPVDVWHFSTDGTYSAGVANIPTLGFGPEEEKYVHTSQDQVDLEKLRKAAEFFALFPFIYGGQE
jgi:acetylornithine deacetylase/succinyl-diaminopimelate desuccinylase-like protein